jgi:hypothetical protein
MKEKVIAIAMMIKETKNEYKNGAPEVDLLSLLASTIHIKTNDHIDISKLEPKIDAKMRALNRQCNYLQFIMIVRLEMLN